MTLIDKLMSLKEKGKKAALAGILLTSGCANWEPGPLHPSEIIWGDRFKKDDGPKYSNPPQKEDPHIKYEPRFGGHLYIVSCNFIKDVNNDKFITYPDEYFGIKESFNKGERIDISLGTCGKKFDDIEYILVDINNNNREIEKNRKENVASWGCIYNATESELEKRYPNGKLPEGQINELKQGNYRVIWCSKGEIVATWDFRVSEDKLVSNK